MQYPTAPTPRLLLFFGDQLIDTKQPLIKSGIGKKTVAHWIGLPVISTLFRKPPASIIFKLIEEALIRPSNNVIKIKGNPISNFGYAHAA
ncbi:MAG: hypothetical protein L0Y39_09860 [Methylococcaceae bacterium]|nr:hypothetical protein [Methylococcaceae bacterium]